MNIHTHGNVGLSKGTRVLLLHEENKIIPQSPPNQVKLPDITMTFTAKP
jgi:hypothetical protein